VSDPSFEIEILEQRLSLSFVLDSRPLRHSPKHQRGIARPIAGERAEAGRDTAASSIRRLVALLAPRHSG